MPKKIPHKKHKCPDTYDLENEFRRHLMGGMSSLRLSLEELKDLVEFLGSRPNTDLEIMPMLDGSPQFFYVVPKNGGTVKIVWHQGKWTAKIE